MRYVRGALAAAAVAAAAGMASATPLRLDYCVQALSGGVYRYTFTLTLDNNDGSWFAGSGQGWDWFIFGDADIMTSPFHDFVIDPGSLPVGPWTELGGSQGGHNGPTFQPVTEAFWVPNAVGESLTWSGTSSVFIDEPGMLFSTLNVENGAFFNNFEVAHRIGCGPAQGACCRPDGSCIVIDAASCTNLAGVYRGNGSGCGSANCPQPATGACCLDSGCQVLSQARCTSLGGSYAGNNVTCGNANCPPATAFRESGDAGDLPSNAAIASGSGPLNTIHGSFSNFIDADMYRIRICDPAGFSASLSGIIIGEIYLFGVDGNGIVQRWGFNGPAMLTNMFTSQLPAGEYYLAVAPFFKTPRNINDDKIWEDHFDNDERAPDGPGAPGPIDHWDQGGGFDGQYLIELTGACFVGGNPPPSCYANCDHSTNAPILNVNDFICFQQQFAAGASYANCDGSTQPPVLNVNDFICFQQHFAGGCTAP